MKITHILPLFTQGGAQVVVIELANFFADDGHKVTVIAASPVNPKLLRSALRPNINIHYISISYSSRFLKYFKMPLWLWKNRFWIREQDILHCHLTYGAVFGTLSKKILSIMRLRVPKIVETYHAVGMPISKIIKWFHKSLMVHRDAVVLMHEDEYWKRYLANYPKLICKCIPNGISISKYKPINYLRKNIYRKQLGIPHDCKFLITTVSRMESDRKPWLYLPVFAEISRILEQKVYFIMAGDGKELNRTKLLAMEHGLEDRVIFPGLVLDPKPIISAADIYITLSFGRFTGISGIESALMGVPVLGIQLFSKYLVNSKDWIWSSNDPLNLANKIIQILKYPKVKKKTINKQRGYALLNCSTKKMSSAYYQLYKTLLNFSNNKINLNK